ncbi:2',5' RNA ligase family [Planctomycetes bacterium Poly30]|uniref:RNA 2',3'-cyclic phosphodiesterase n=1 Tax=Saltatorellus ferox TaxID=2528018 RepID=A0A518ETB3_9BACT|nr:2',5' RNA ligase family [Planctomycetes bacterium Poly30]
MQRLFFGLSVDPVVGQSLIRAARRALGAELSEALYGEEVLHLTLCFLGSFPRDRVKSLVQSARDEFVGLWAPELLLGGEGDAFPDRGTPRTLHTAVEEVGDATGRLGTIRNRTMQVAMSHGWRASQAERARPFRPHVTLARLSGRPDSPIPEDSGAAAFADLDDFWDLGAERRWLPVDITLYESLGRSEDGERYRQLAAWPLAVRPG